MSKLTSSYVILIDGFLAVTSKPRAKNNEEKRVKTKVYIIIDRSSNPSHDSDSESSPP